MATEPYSELGGLEHPGPYDQGGAKYRPCPACGAEPMQKCTFWANHHVHGEGLVRKLTPRHMPCLERIINRTETP